ncbi:hypothetical protein niasHS_005230 [Heterodera schachtii]
MLVDPLVPSPSIPLSKSTTLESSLPPKSSDIKSGNDASEKTGTDDSSCPDTSPPSSKYTDPEFVVTIVQHFFSSSYSVPRLALGFPHGCA